MKKNKRFEPGDIVKSHGRETYFLVTDYKEDTWGNWYSYGFAVKQSGKIINGNFEQRVPYGSMHVDEYFNEIERKLEIDKKQVREIQENASEILASFRRRKD